MTSMKVPTFDPLTLNPLSQRLLRESGSPGGAWVEGLREFRVTIKVTIRALGGLLPPTQTVAYTSTSACTSTSASTS